VREQQNHQRWFPFKFQDTVSDTVDGAVRSLRFRIAWRIHTGRPLHKASPAIILPNSRKFLSIRSNRIIHRREQGTDEEDVRGVRHGIARVRARPEKEKIDEAGRPGSALRSRTGSGRKNRRRVVLQPHQKPETELQEQPELGERTGRRLREQGRDRDALLGLQFRRKNPGHRQHATLRTGHPPGGVRENAHKPMLGRLRLRAEVQMAPPFGLRPG
jgi:hypothetical protein